TATTTHARSWQLQTTHQGPSFFNGFSFFNSPDPTHGFVDYVDQDTATNLGLIAFDEEEDDEIVEIRSGAASTQGRSSIRIQSDTTYNQGLFLFDVEHMPAGCGTWPAIWLNGPDWPNGGEIDVVEGVNLQTHNLITLHTGQPCEIAPNTSQLTPEPTGDILTSKCQLNSPGQQPHQGCTVEYDSSYSYGSSFNEHDGGVFVLQIDDDGIESWFFDRNHIPDDIDDNEPVLDPSHWWTDYQYRPAALFPFDGTHCSATAFHDLRIIINLTFCGEWAGVPETYNLDCPGSCVDYVASAPLPEAYWRIRSVKIYQ
ncbi:beta-1,3-1,4-glucanase, partial [Lichtheimia hyalospora FSU 10163]